MSAERPMTSWRSHLSEYVKANFQIDVTFINKPHIQSLKVHSRLKKILKGVVDCDFTFLTLVSV